MNAAEKVACAHNRITRTVAYEGAGGAKVAVRETWTCDDCLMEFTPAARLAPLMDNYREMAERLRAVYDGTWAAISIEEIEAWEATYAALLEPKP